MLWGWNRIKYPNHEIFDDHTGITVIIPVRNEEANIEGLLEDLKSQDFPDSKYEVIIVDDNSSDRTGDIVRSWIAGDFSNLRLIASNTSKFSTHAPKKAAIRTAVEKARFELIIQTDGDSRVGINWLSSFSQMYLKDRPKLIAGPVMYLNGNRIGKFLQVELASLVGVGAATLYLNKPTMCNGANLFYEKKAFYESGSYGEYSSYPSGDDEFLLHNIHKKYPGEIRFLKDRKALVMTNPPRTFKEFVNQRIRWASKWRLHKGLRNKLLAVFIFAINFMVLIMGASIFLLSLPWELFVTVFLVKISAEYFFLRKVLTDMGIGMNIITFILTSILYPFYASIFGILVNLIKPVWKTRRLK